ncbi:MAG: hypothetical protein GTO45_28670 [Candidatus Aminicenantes bacterium]|nr:hypothetical protein [Candidatus Aminicenantes bacterium]NIM82773.1 hypothetical protein [Candidatus Aminicenantes bacterium]NIN22148.1 hypothetical protein [Candidatus Aminicenantes bacterium]NIN45905.1 hypothetical protein [Candidatus Aminicenantes bacterium]NIN88744.1 hypothetical protein [Candidatus Aminicenantes bacterium]
MKLKLLTVLVLVSIIVFGFLMVNSLTGSCCSLGKKCCCKEKAGKSLTSWGCVCSGGELIESFCGYEEPIQ